MRKTREIVRSISFAALIIVGTAGIFLTDIQQKKYNEKLLEKASISALTSVCASINEAETLFDKGEVFDTLSTDSKSIYAHLLSAKTVLALCDYNTENTQRWLTTAIEYTKTNMTDDSKNKKLRNELNELSKTLIEICGNYQGNKSFDRLEEVFKIPRNDEQVKRTLDRLQREYSILENNIVSPQKDLNQYAKEILNSPFPPSFFKGNYTLPRALCYSGKNAYVNIFYAGKYLDSMASEDTSPAEEKNDNSFDSEAKKAMEILAPYAAELEPVYKTIKNGLVYYVYCPVKKHKESYVSNYTEPLRLALSQKDCDVKAFDASAYLKHHENGKELPDIPDLPQISLDLSSYEVLSEKIVFTEHTVHKEYKLNYNDNVVYCVALFSDGRHEIYTEYDYFSHFGLI